MNLPDWAVTAQTIWVALGSLLIVFAAQGIGIPEVLLEIFSQATVDAILAVVGSVIVFVQYVRNNILTKLKDDEGEVQVLSTGAKVMYFVNPFKLRAA